MHFNTVQSHSTTNPRKALSKELFCIMHSLKQAT